MIANMGAELGATTTVFPSDGEVRRFLKSYRREPDWIELVADADAEYDLHEEIDLSRLEPLIAMPTSPGNVVPVREVAGRPIYQAYVGSSANPGYRDFAMAAEIVKGVQVAPQVSFDVNPTSRQILENLVRDGHLQTLVHAGREFIRPVATAASGWGRHRRPASSACGPCRGIFPAAPAPATTRFASSARRRPPPRPEPA